MRLAAPITIRNAIRKVTKIKPRCFFVLLALGLWSSGPQTAAQQTPDHIVIVIMENHSYEQIIGSADCPYINLTLAANGALLTDSHAVEHPSQPNYLDLFSGSNQGVTDDALPANIPFSAPNLGAKLIEQGRRFAIYSESLPVVGFTGASFTDDPAKPEYVRKHNPAVNWQATDAPTNNHLSPAVNQPFTAFPATNAGFDALPTISFVIPNEQNDMHDGSIARGDRWLSDHLEEYRSWAMAHNSLLILTFDEDDSNAPTNHIVTIFAGQNVKPGLYSEAIVARAPGAGVDHFNVLRTIEDIYDLGICNPAADGMRKPVTDLFRTESASSLLNSSTRVRTGNGDDVMIGGLIIEGSSRKEVVVRGLGPSLSVDGAAIAGALQDPTIELHQGDGSVIAFNDDWQTTQQNEIRATGLSPTDNRESAIVMSLDPGSYTAIVSGKAGTGGIGLVEIYDVEPTSTSRLVNMATRGRVGTGDSVMIAGFIVGGPDSSRVMVRGLGPSLNDGPAGISDALQDPTLELHDTNGDAIVFNDNWKEAQEFEIEGTGLAPTDEYESAVVATFAPGNYTAIIRGKDDAAGIALVETYKLD